MKSNNWRVSSPNGKCEAIVYAWNNCLSMDVLFSNVLLFSVRDISLGKNKPLLLFEEECFSKVSDNYSLPIEKGKFFANHYNEIKLRFSSLLMNVRVYNDGCAYRLSSSAKSLDEEGGEVVFPLGYSNSFLQNWIATYENPYLKRPAREGERYGMPCLFEVLEKNWILISEASVINTHGNYCSSSFIGTSNGGLRISFAPEQKSSIQNKKGMQTPWRAFMLASNLKDLLNNRLVWNLNDKSEIDDCSWIKPSRNLWSWWSFENGAELFSEQLKYVDFASAFGFEGVTVDAGWDGTWVPELCKYAASRNVGIWIWTDMESLSSYKRAKPLIEKWASWGVKGLKIDFFMDDSAERMKQYDTIARLMLENRLMINFHGNTKPAGEGRTWPFLISEEGIMGLEHYKWSDMPDSVHNTTVPFTRNVIGPMDYTPTGFSNRNRNTTQAHQLALSLVFGCGILHIAESIYSLLPWKGLEFLRLLKPSYDYSELLDGYPGKRVVMMRRSGQEYYIAGITVDAIIEKVPLSFLPEGEYKARVFEDSDTEDCLEVADYEVDRNTILNFELCEHGGFAIYISRQIGDDSRYIFSGFMKKPTIEFDSFQDGRDICVSPKLEGFCTVRIFYSADESCYAEISGKHVNLDATGGLGTLRVHDVIHKFPESFVVESSKKFSVEKIQIIENNPHIEVFYKANLAKMDGTASLRQDNESVTGICENGSVLFEHIYIQRAGRYIVAFDYYLGTNRKALITVNEDEPIESVFFNSGGWAEGNWNIKGRKELLLHLKEGCNSIRFSSSDQEGPDLDGIGISFYD